MDKVARVARVTMEDSCKGGDGLEAVTQLLFTAQFIPVGNYGSCYILHYHVYQNQYSIYSDLQRETETV